MPEEEIEQGKKRLDRGNVQVWEVTEPWIDIECQLGEGPYYEADTHMVRFTDVFGRKIYWVDVEKGPSSLRSVDVEDWVGVTADIAGIDDQILVAAKYGYALMHKATGKLTYIARVYDDSKDGAGKSERMRFNDGAIDPHGRFWAGSMTDNSKYPVETEGTLFRLDPSPFPSNSASEPPTALFATPHPVLSPVTIPNGIGWTPDQKTMLFTDSPSRTISAFDYDGATGSIGERREWFKLDGWIRLPKAQSTTTDGKDSEGKGYEDCHFPEGAVPDGFQLDEDGNLWSAVWGAGMVVRISEVDVDGGKGGRERVITGVVRLPTACTSCPRFVRGGGMVVTSAAEDGSVEGRKAQGRVFWVDVGVEGGRCWKFGERAV